MSISAADLEKLIEERRVTTPLQLEALRQELIDRLTLWFNQKIIGSDALPPIDQLNASSVIIEVQDAQNGCVYRRQVPLEFYENDNGIRLQGENLLGEPSEIAFLSAKALAKMHDLTGKGADSDHCGHHAPHTDTL